MAQVRFGDVSGGKIGALKRAAILDFLSEGWPVVGHRQVETVVAVQDVLRLPAQHAFHQIAMQWPAQVGAGDPADAENLARRTLTIGRRAAAGDDVDIDGLPEPGTGKLGNR
ncbi:MAG: hypothetical protein GY736_22825 [Sphingomonas sp.]|uniref:hypothetical protein n=1 Tax=Sphingomonas sp. TaxID=28214 RepID=UPI0025891A71|nr:hypothetical protein [Sphingomonas sp.]MCP4029129.1 hypothetical protein [Sphingomonas sp.]